MPFDSPTRNKLQKMVASSRRILTEEFTSQLQGLYGVQPTGEITNLASMSPLDDEQHTVASLLRERIDHLAGGLSTDKKEAKEAIDRVIREQAFTVLNRFAALRMCEERGIVQECIRGGFQSRGFQVYCTTVGASLGGIYERYRVFLQCVFDEISVDLGILFDRFSPLGLLFPREPALVEVLKVLNDTELTDIWKDDETIGWIYQYFNSKEEREAMRKASAAPRNSRELAVRNQFFTPRYVVEFLTDNTLGRIWYEMTKGETRLTEACRYLVRRPNEIFLAEGEEPPQVEEDKRLEKSQEELLKEPVQIPHRPLKDPREIRMLDPACGSMHFGLYAFDLYEHIYEEAWDHYSELMLDLREEYPTEEEFRKRIPELILRHNIHGIDIDLRACQIAGLSLWLRAQRSYQQLGLKPRERTRITRANVVCAEPMPGEKDLLEEFISSFRGKQRIVGELVREVWEKMQLAGEAGSLLKIELELREAIERVRKEWEDVRRGQTLGQLPMWPDPQPLRQMELRTALVEIKKEAFWDQAEGLVLDALGQFAEKAVNGKDYQRKLFAEDAVQGFAFIDLCRKKYDVVVMNPPFGNPIDTKAARLREFYRKQTEDLYCWFAERASQLAPQGLIGLISSNSFIRYTDYALYRSFLIDGTDLAFLCDLGWNVLDGAYVSASMYTFRSSSNHSNTIFVDLTNTAYFEADLFNTINKMTYGEKDHFVYIHSLHEFRVLDSSPFCFWLDSAFIKWLGASPKLKEVLRDHGIGVGPHNFFFRLHWELSAEGRSRLTTWPGLANGGSFSPYYRDDYLCIDWRGNGSFIKAHLNRIYPYLKGNVGIKIQREHTYYKPGITYGKRGDRFNAQVLPEGMIPSFEGIGMYPKSKTDIWWLLAFLNSRFVAYYLNLTCGLHKNAVYIDRVPLPEFSENSKLLLATHASEIYLLVRDACSTEEISLTFRTPIIALADVQSIRQAALKWRLRDRDREVRIWSHQSAIEEIVLWELRCFERLNIFVTEDQGPDLVTFGNEIKEPKMALLALPSKVNTVGRPLINRDDGLDSTDLYRFAMSHRIRPDVASKLMEDLEYISEDHLMVASLQYISWLVGCVLGRWDIRVAKEPSHGSDLGSPFDLRPVCPPGMLIGPDGLPAQPGRIASQQWLLARPNAITLPPEGSVSRPTIPDEIYPLRITWSGILVDDSDGDETQAHPEDIVHRVREVLNFLWGERTLAIEQEACEILGLPSLRDYFRKPSGFFDDHLKRYSKSRRKAPIYWPLSTESGSYTLWIYYHRLTDQTLYQCVNDYVNPKLDSVNQDVEKVRGEVLKGGTTKQRDQLEKLQKFLQELMDFRGELLRVAELPYKPNLNDGVLITASPLHKLFRLPRWRKDVEECWKKLESGEYDWAHLAYSIWPNRVREKAKKDKSIAIAHGLEELYEEVAAPKKTKRGKKSV